MIFISHTICFIIIIENAPTMQTKWQHSGKHDKMGYEGRHRAGRAEISRRAFGIVPTNLGYAVGTSVSIA